MGGEVQRDLCGERRHRRHHRERQQCAERQRHARSTSRRGIAVKNAAVRLAFPPARA
jgi:hypothetical protein